MQASKIVLRDAMKCIGMHIGGYIYSHGKDNRWLNSCWEIFVASVADWQW